MENAPDHVIASASAGLNRAGVELGAEVIALLQTAGSQVEVGNFWSRSGDQASVRRVLKSGQLLYDAISAASLIVEAGSPLAQLLSEAISGEARSFLLFPWQGAKVITGVIGFAEPEPPVRRLPEAVLENLDLLGLVTWSAREIARLRAELRIVNERLAGRKLVERAKSALQMQQRISEEQAYTYLRGESRKRRITLAELSAEVLAGHSGRGPIRLRGQQPKPAA
jgi:ANTAR domain